MARSGALFLLLLPLLMGATSASLSAKNTPAPGSEMASKSADVSRSHCVHSAVEPARAGDAPQSERNGSATVAKGALPTSYGVAFYIAPGCEVAVTGEGLRALPPEGREGHLIPLQRR